MATLRTILKKFYDSHQITKSINILEAALAKDDELKKLKPVRCVYEFFVPGCGWGRNAERASTEEERCFYCRKKIGELYSGFSFDKNRVNIPSPDNDDCKLCYAVLAKEFAKPYSTLKLANCRKAKKCSIR